MRFSLILAGFITLTACSDQQPLQSIQPEQQHPRATAILDGLRAAGYQGPVLLTQQVPTDLQGAGEEAWTLSLPPEGVRLVRERMGAAGTPGAMLPRSLSAASEVSDPEQIDPGNNTPSSQLTAGSIVSPSILNCDGGRQLRSTLAMRTALFAYDPKVNDWYQLTTAHVVQTRIRARDNAAGHYHGPDGTEQLERRMGTVEPANGPVTDGVWRHTWNVPEFAQEVYFELEVRYRHRNTPEEETTDWFFGTSPNVSRFRGLSRIPANEQYYDRVGGTASHPETLNDFGDAGLVQQMQQAARLYNLASGDRTRVNDMSLPFGGRFDIGGGWQGSHVEHRFAEVDTRPYEWNDAGRTKFRAALLAAGFTPARIVVEGDHFHVRGAASVYPCRSR